MVAKLGQLGCCIPGNATLGIIPMSSFLVAGGGLDFVNDRWLPARNHFFVRVEPLSILFRAKMRNGLQRAGLYRQIPSAAWRQAWVVHSKSVVMSHAVAYLADYVFRVGVANRRIVKLDIAVTFWYKERKTNRRVSVTLPVFTFMQRFLQHVLPQGFVKVRYYGFLAPGKRERLALARELLAADHKAQQRLFSTSRPSDPDGDAPPRLACPHCGQPLRLTDTIRQRSRCPP